MRFIPDAQTTAAELETHQIDLIAVPQNSLDQYRSVEGVVVETGAPTNGQSLLLINVSKPTLRGLAVRRAIAAAVPYGAILHDVDHDLASEARNVLPSTAIGYEALPPRKYDPAAARDILERAGWRCGPDGVRTRNGVRLAFTLAIVAGFTGFGQEALLLQSSLKTVGVELAIKTYSYRTMFAAPERTALRGFLRPRVERRPPQLGSRPVQSLGLRSLVPTGAKHLSLLRSTSRCARTQRPANRRPVASRPHLSEGKSPDMVGNPVRSFIPWTRPNCTLRRLAQLQR